MSDEHPPRPALAGLPEGAEVIGYGHVVNPADERINSQYRFLGIAPADGSDGPMDDGWYMIADEFSGYNRRGTLVFIPEGPA